MKHKHIIRLFLLYLTLNSGNVLAQSEEGATSATADVTPVTDISSVQQAFNAQQQADQIPSHGTVIKQSVESLTKAKNSGENALGLESGYQMPDPMWLPTGFWDGPDQADLGFTLLTFVFGEPIKFVFNKVSATPLSDPILAPDDPTYRATLATTFASMMNTLGILMIGGVLLAYIFTFFFKRSVEIGYLKSEEKDENMVSLFRGSMAMLGSLPMTIFYGLSSFQVITISAVLLGLGMASAVIKVGVDNFLTPSVVATQYPSVNDFVDNMLWSKICAVKLKDEFDSKNREIAGSKGINGSYLYINKVKKPIRPYAYTIDHNPQISYTTREEFQFSFGPEAECGSGKIGEIPRTDVAPEDWDNANEAVMTYTKSVMGKAVAEVLQRAWNSQLFEELAENLLKEDYYQQVDSDGNKKLINDAKEFAQFKQTQSRYVTGVIHNALKDLYGSELKNIPNVNELVDAIADVGMFGLGSTYITLAQLQDSFNDPIEESFSGINDITWMSNQATPWSKSPTLVSHLMNLINSNNGGVSEEEMEGYLQRYNMFINSPYAKGSSEILTTSINSLKTEGMLEPLNWLAIKVATHMLAFSQDLSLNDRTFLASVADPILTLRNMGRIIQNGVLTMYGVSWLKDKAESFFSDSSSGEGSGGDGEDSPGILKLVFFSLFVWGFLMTNLLPNIPYIMWTIASFSYLSFATLAIIGTGWWGGGMTMKGQDPNSVMGRSTEGMNILISLTIRPPLMVIGFFLAILLNKMLGLLVVSTIEPAIQSASSGITNPLAFVGLLITFTVVLTIGIYKNCSLIWEFTDLFMRWIGLDKDHLKQDGSQEAQQQFISSSTSASTKLGGIISSSMKKGTPSLS